uniref:Sterile alpha motif domain containing 1a n=1 Tax=Tetraodon nigroviridis TaxID=99883 RepID=H3CYL6_TETNG
YREWILDTIDSLRSRKARPDLDRICRMVRRRHGSEPDRTCAELEKLIQEQTVLKVNYKGSISYRNAAKVQRRSRKRGASVGTSAERWRGGDGRDSAPPSAPQPQTQWRGPRLPTTCALWSGSSPRSGAGSGALWVSDTQSHKQKRRRRRRAGTGRRGPLRVPRTRRPPRAVPPCRPSLHPAPHLAPRPARGPAPCPRAAPGPSQTMTGPIILPSAQQSASPQECRLLKEHKKGTLIVPSSIRLVLFLVLVGRKEGKIKKKVTYLRLLSVSAGATKPSVQPVPASPGATKNNTKADDGGGKAKESAAQQDESKNASDGKQQALSLPSNNYPLQRPRTRQICALNPHFTPQQVHPSIIPPIIGADKSAVNVSPETRPYLMSTMFVHIFGSVLFAGTFNNKVEMPPLTVAENTLLNGDKDDEVSVKKEMSQNLLQWTVADVASYFSAAGFPEQAVAFRAQEIDGKSLLLMQRSDVLTGLSIRLGPALKIYERHVKVLQRTHF